MTKFDKGVLWMKAWAQCKLVNFIHDEEGDVNIVSMVVLIGIAVLLAVMFKNQIRDLLDTLMGTITQNATDAVN